MLLSLLSNRKAYTLHSAHLILVSTVSLLKVSAMKLLKETKLEHILLHSYWSGCCLKKKKYYHWN